jgi:hypothetical protein
MARYLFLTVAPLVITETIVQAMCLVGVCKYTEFRIRDRRSK